MSFCFVGRKVRMSAAGSIPRRNNTRKAKRASTPKPADQINPFLNPENILDRANPMEGRPFSQTRTISEIRIISKSRAIPRAIIRSPRCLETTNHLAPSMQRIAARDMVRVFIWICFACNCFSRSYTVISSLLPGFLILFREV